MNVGRALRQWTLRGRNMREPMTLCPHWRNTTASVQLLDDKGCGPPKYPWGSDRPLPAGWSSEHRTALLLRPGIWRSVEGLHYRWIRCCTSRYCGVYKRYCWRLWPRRICFLTWRSGPWAREPGPGEEAWDTVDIFENRRLTWWLVGKLLAVRQIESLTHS